MAMAVIVGVYLGIHWHVAAVTFWWTKNVNQSINIRLIAVSAVLKY